jgi:hypothetical protein
MNKGHEVRKMIGMSVRYEYSVYGGIGPSGLFKLDKCASNVPSDSRRYPGAFLSTEGTQVPLPSMVSIMELDYKPKRRLE